MGFFDWLKSLFGAAPAREVKLPPPKLPSLPPPPKKPVPPPPPETSYEFEPISRSELRKQADAPDVRSAAFRWNTGVIPPKDDPRVKLIDRAMVTRGLLTSDQLTEIHRIGDLMEIARSGQAEAQRLAREAVARRKEDRERIKAEKKRLAEEKRRRHAADVAQRHATDIVFLGRGVSAGLANRVSDAAKLQQLGLPLLSTPADVARALGLPIPKLRWLAYHSEAATTTHYRRWQIPKKSGGMREISAPLATLAAAQRWIFGSVLSKLPPDAPAHGFVRGRSTVTNAAPHVKRKVVVNLDLKDFFPTIEFPRVRGLFERLGYSPAVSTIFALLATESPRQTVAYDGKPYHVALGPRALPQGACTSPSISNLIVRTLDRRLAKPGWTYTRYADDLTFSGDDPSLVGKLLARVRHVVLEEGFEVNPKKVRVQRPNAAQIVTGIVVNEKPNVPRKERRRLRAALHQKRVDASVRGMLSYVKMVNPALAAKLTS